MLRVIFPLALLLAGAMTAWAISSPLSRLGDYATQGGPLQVEIMAVEPRSVRLKIRSQGTVRACTDMKLTAQVDGKVVKMAPGFKEGKFFKEGDVLIQIEPWDYDLAVVKARVAAA